MMLLAPSRKDTPRVMAAAVAATASAAAAAKAVEANPASGGGGGGAEAQNSTATTTTTTTRRASCTAGGSNTRRQSSIAVKRAASQRQLLIRKNSSRNLDASNRETTNPKNGSDHGDNNTNNNNISKLYSSSRRGSLARKNSSRNNIDLGASNAGSMEKSERRGSLARRNSSRNTMDTSIAHMEKSERRGSTLPKRNSSQNLDRSTAASSSSMDKSERRGSLLTRRNSSRNVTEQHPPNRLTSGTSDHNNNNIPGNSNSKPSRRTSLRRKISFRNNDNTSAMVDESAKTAPFRRAATTTMVDVSSKTTATTRTTGSGGGKKKRSARRCKSDVEKKLQPTTRKSPPSKESSSNMDSTNHPTQKSNNNKNDDNSDDDNNKPSSATEEGETTGPAAPGPSLGSLLVVQQAIDKPILSRLSRSSSFDSKLSHASYLLPPPPPSPTKKSGKATSKTKNHVSSSSTLDMPTNKSSKHGSKRTSLVQNNNNNKRGRTKSTSNSNNTGVSKETTTTRPRSSSNKPKLARRPRSSSNKPKFRRSRTTSNHEKPKLTRSNSLDSKLGLMGEDDDDHINNSVDQQPKSKKEQLPQEVSASNNLSLDQSIASGEIQIEIVVDAAPSATAAAAAAILSRPDLSQSNRPPSARRLLGGSGSGHSKSSNHNKPKRKSSNKGKDKDNTKKPSKSPARGGATAGMKRSNSVGSRLSESQNNNKKEATAEAVRQRFSSKPQKQRQPRKEEATSEAADANKKGPNGLSSQLKKSSMRRIKSLDNSTEHDNLSNKKKRGGKKTLSSSSRPSLVRSNSLDSKLSKIEGGGDDEEAQNESSKPVAAIPENTTARKEPDGATTIDTTKQPKQRPSLSQMKRSSSRKLKSLDVKTEHGTARRGRKKGKNNNNANGNIDERLTLKRSNSLDSKLSTFSSLSGNTEDTDIKSIATKEMNKLRAASEAVAAEAKSLLLSALSKNKGLASSPPRPKVLNSKTHNGNTGKAAKNGGSQRVPTLARSNSLDSKLSQMSSNSNTTNKAANREGQKADTKERALSLFKKNGPPLRRARTQETEATDDNSIPPLTMIRTNSLDSMIDSFAGDGGDEKNKGDDDVNPHDRNTSQNAKFLKPTLIRKSSSRRCLANAGSDHRLSSNNNDLGRTSEHSTTVSRRGRGPGQYGRRSLLSEHLAAAVNKGGPLDPRAIATNGHFHGNNNDDNRQQQRGRRSNSVDSKLGVPVASGKGEDDDQPASRELTGNSTRGGAARKGMRRVSSLAANDTNMALKAYMERSAKDEAAVLEQKKAKREKLSNIQKTFQTIAKEQSKFTDTLFAKMSSLSKVPAVNSLATTSTHGMKTSASTTSLQQRLNNHHSVMNKRNSIAGPSPPTAALAAAMAATAAGNSDGDNSDGRPLGALKRAGSISNMTQRMKDLGTNFRLSRKQSVENVEKLVREKRSSTAKLGGDIPMLMSKPLTVPPTPSIA